MDKSKTIETIEKFYNLIGLDHDPTIEEKEFIRNFELEMVKSMLNEFSNDNLYKIAKILLVMAEPKKECNYTLPTMGRGDASKLNYNTFSYPEYVNTGITIG